MEKIKSSFYFCCLLALIFNSCASNLLKNNDYPNFNIAIEPRALYPDIDSFGYKVNRVRKEGSYIFLSIKETNKEHKYWIEKVDSLKHNFHIIESFKKERKTQRKRNKKNKNKNKNSLWAYGAPIPNWSKFDTLSLNIDLMELDSVLCKLSYLYNTSENIFMTSGKIEYEKIQD